MITKSMGQIDWNKSAAELERLVRGLNPWPSAFTGWNHKILKIWKASVCEENSSFMPGQVARVSGDGICVQTGQGLLCVRELQLEGKKRMEADAFLRGNEMKEGAELTVSR